MVRLVSPGKPYQDKPEHLLSPWAVVIAGGALIVLAVVMAPDAIERSQERFGSSEDLAFTAISLVAGVVIAVRGFMRMRDES